MFTGGAGFIGSELIQILLDSQEFEVINIDKLTYASNLNLLDRFKNHNLYTFEQIDICNQKAIKELFERYQPSGLFHLAAESHVDRSIDNAQDFIQTNICGTYNLLCRAQEYLTASSNPDFKFIHISTDEVYGTVQNDIKFSEVTPYSPNSPYSASKASSDLLVRAWNKTYNFPSIITNCSNNYGTLQFPEKLIPLVINKCIQEKAIPVYGDGKKYQRLDTCQ